MRVPQKKFRIQDSEPVSEASFIDGNTIQDFLNALSELQKRQPEASTVNTWVNYTYDGEFTLHFTMERPNPNYEEEMKAYEAHLAEEKRKEEERLKMERATHEGQLAKGEFKKARREERIQAKGPIQEGYAIQYPDGRFAGLDSSGVYSSGDIYPTSLLTQVYVTQNPSTLAPFARPGNPQGTKIVKVSLGLSLLENS